MDIQRSIFIVDDDDFYRNLFVNKFREEKFRVSSAVDGQNAWASLQSDIPDIMLTGILMPNLDGFSLIERVRKDPRMQRMKVFILSHYGRDEDRKRAEALLADGFFTMGYTPFPEIVMKIEASLKGFPTFRIQMRPEELDGASGSALLELGKSLACRLCGEPFTVTLEPDPARPLGDLRAHVVCPDCEKKGSTS